MKILLVEPDYKNKYPPIGLMKISTYHKRRGDHVVFFKGLINSHDIWDRVYISTLFTFHWDIVVKTIEYYKQKVRKLDDIYVGGIMATLLNKELKETTGLKNIIVGIIDNSSILEFNDNINIDQLCLDYEILSDIEYQYPAGDNFFGYTTRGCINKCNFCAVPKLEGELNVTNNIKSQITEIRNLYGDKRNLLLLDNNILGLEIDELKKIVDDLNEIGFVKKANYIKPLEIDLLVNSYNRHIIEGRSPIKVMNKLVKYFNNLYNMRISKQNREKLDSMIAKIGEVYEDVIECILDNYYEIREIEKKYSYKLPLQRYVDFNQGLDARELTEEKMRIISKLPIRPFRIAFDNIELTETYIKALRLANKYGVQEFSNYILYNYTDKPEDLYKRIEINISLSEEFNKHIYSFPMKYEPVYSKTRGSYIGKYWRKHYLNNVKAILNVSKGVFGGNRSFFVKAFGRNLEEYYEILSMPEDMVKYRNYYEEIGLTQEWKKLFNKLDKNEKKELLQAVEDGKTKSNNPIINELLPYYKIDYEKDIKNKNNGCI